jgi:hypothetical protein
MKLPISPLARTVLVVGITAGLATGVTLAATRPQATVEASSVSTTTARLKVRTTNHDWSGRAPGFRIRNLIPGTGVTKQVYFKNEGGVALKLAVQVPDRPERPRDGYGFRGWENLLVDITGEACGQTIHTTMAVLLDRHTPVNLPCNPLPAVVAGSPGSSGHAGNYSLHFDLQQDAITEDHAGVGDFDLAFTGTQS